MASSSQILLLLATAALLLSAAPTHASSRSLFADPCKDTLHRKLCRSFLVPGKFQTRASLTIDMIKHTMTRLKSASEHAERLANATKERVRGMYLLACKSDYEVAYVHLEKGLELIRASGSNKQIKYNLSWAWSSIGTCKAEWKETNIEDFPLEHGDAMLNKLGQNIYELGFWLGTMNKEADDDSVSSGGSLRS